MSDSKFPEISWIRIDDKDDHDIFVGRRELQGDVLESMLRQREDDDGNWGTTGKATAIVAPPGVGKTALLSTIVSQLKRSRVGVIEVSADQMATEASLVKQFARAKIDLQAARNEEWWKQEHARTETAKNAVEVISGPVGELVAKGTSLAFGIPALEDIQSAVKHVKELLGRSSGPDPLDVLSQWDQAFPQGWAVVLDEAQQLTELQDNSTAGRFLRALLSPKSRRVNHLRRGNLLMAGLNDTQHALERCNVTRPRYLTLPTLGAESVKELIDSHISAGEHANGGQQVPNRSEWIEILSERFGQWTLHAQSAACLAAMAAEYYPDEPSALDKVISESEFAVQEHYRTRVDAARDFVDAKPLALIMQAERESNGNFRRSQLMELIEETRSWATSKTMQEHDSRDIFYGLLHSGVLAHGSDELLTVPIPSMRTYCENRFRGDLS